MPYIKPENRSPIMSGERLPANSGELNFQITTYCRLYLESNGESYQTYNDIIGALEGCKLEIYRRKVSLYEDNKKENNGDVF